MPTDELRHYGVLGMRWGVRRTPAQLARARGKLTRSTSDSDKNTSSDSSTNKPAKKSISSMTDSELQAAVNRLNLEKRYKELNPEKVSAGKKFVDTMVKQVITPVMIDASKNVLRPYIENSIKSAINKASKKKK